MENSAEKVVKLEFPHKEIQPKQEKQTRQNKHSNSKPKIMPLQRKLNFNPLTEQKNRILNSFIPEVNINNIIIDDFFIDKAFEILNPLFVRLTNRTRKEFKNTKIFSDDELDFVYNFYQNKYFLQNTLVKFFLQVDDKILYVPNSLQSLDNYKREQIPLFEGFDTTKQISLKYYPTCSKEVFNFIN